MRPRTALVLANGEPPPPALLRQQAEAADWFVCTDGALSAALASGVTPAAVAGDFDSLPAVVPAAVEQVLTPAQDTNDLEKTLALVAGRGFSRAVVLGAGGGRWDQFYANLGVFARYAATLSIEAGDAHGWLTTLAAGPWHDCDLAAGTVVSLLPLPAAEGVCITGVRWPLKQATLHLMDGGFSISNEAVAPPVQVRYASGCLAVYQVTA